MARFHNINGVEVPFTAEEEAAKDTFNETKEARTLERQEAETARQAKLVSGKAKLKELGLDDDELKQILGI